MPLLAIPNVSEGRDKAFVSRAAAQIRQTGGRVLDVHVDIFHNRSVFTVAGSAVQLVDSMFELAQVCKSLSLSNHSGVHPRRGVLDVCPIVPHHSSMTEAITCAKQTADAIGERAGLPVFLYGEAAERPAFSSLVDLRRAGMDALEAAGPDRGPDVIDPSLGIVCIGARDVLIAFNVWLVGGKDEARAIASQIREADGGLPGVRALGLKIDGELSQVSMNLVDPNVTGVDEAFAAVAELARQSDIEVLRTEIVGLVPERFSPDPEREAARLLMRPGRTLESALEASG